jgi:hypothetical protein
MMKTRLSNILGVELTDNDGAMKVKLGELEAAFYNKEVNQEGD